MRLDTLEPEAELARIGEQITQLERALWQENERFAFNVIPNILERTLHAHAVELILFDIAAVRRAYDERKEALQASVMYAPANGIASYNKLWAGQPVTAGEGVVFFTLEQKRFIEYIGDPLPLHWANAVRVEALIDGESYPLSPLHAYDEAEIAAQRLRGKTPEWRFAVTGTPPLGAFATIVFYTQEIPDTLMLPVNAVSVSPLIGTFVWLLIDGEPVETPVRTGVRTGAFIEILYGLAEGDEVVVQ
jgi:hypothetical protein